MHPDPRRMVPVLLVLILLGLAGYYLVWPALNKDGDLLVSGTIEATEVRLSSEFGGRVDAVDVEEGDAVVKGQSLVQVHPGASARAGASARDHTGGDGWIDAAGTDRRERPLTAAQSDAELAEVFGMPSTRAPRTSVHAPASHAAADRSKVQGVANGSPR